MDIVVEFLKLLGIDFSRSFRGRITVEKHDEKRVLTAVIWNVDNKKVAEFQRLPYS